MKVSCPAKLNIGLKINSKRPDGYHDLETEFRLISLYDYLEIKESKNFQLNINNFEIKTEDNLITKAYFLMKSLCNEKSDFSFKVQKNIPIGAGLGGGSSNCASTLIVLNKLFKLNPCGVCETKILFLSRFFIILFFSTSFILSVIGITGITPSFDCSFLITLFINETVTKGLTES